MARGTGIDNELQLKWGSGLADSVNRGRFLAMLSSLSARHSSQENDRVNQQNDSLGDLIGGYGSHYSMHLVLSFIDTLVKNGIADKKRIISVVCR
jgi:hypothetical protein